MARWLLSEPGRNGAGAGGGTARRQGGDAGGADAAAQVRRADQAAAAWEMAEAARARAGQIRAGRGADVLRARGPGTGVQPAGGGVPCAALRAGGHPACGRRVRRHRRRRAGLRAGGPARDAVRAGPGAGAVRRGNARVDGAGGARGRGAGGRDRGGRGRRGASGSTRRGGRSAGGSAIPEDYRRRSPPCAGGRRRASRTSASSSPPPWIMRVAAEYGAELEFLSDGGECKEALLWLGALRSGHALRATLLTDGGEWTLPRGPGGIRGASPARRTGGPCTSRTRPSSARTAWRRWREKLGARLAHPQIAYLTRRRTGPDAVRHGLRHRGALSLLAAAAAGGPDSRGRWGRWSSRSAASRRNPMPCAGNSSCAGPSP